MIKFLFRLAFSGGLPSMIALALFVSAGAFTWLKVHDYNIKEAAILQFNQDQEKIVEQKQEQFKQDTANIQDDASRIREEIANNQKEEDVKVKAIEKQANTEVSKDSQSSAYLKSIIKQLNDLYGSLK